MKRWLLAALLAGLLPANALAQNLGAGQQVFQNWLPGANTTLAVSSVSSNVALPTSTVPATTLVLSNSGAADVHWGLGTSNAVTATASNSLLKAGACVVLNPSPFQGTVYTYLAAITASGSASLILETGIGAPSNCPSLAGNGTVAGTVTANQGTPAATANAWPMKNTDGTNTAAVKPASTNPTAADPALVVAISPNGQNANGSNTAANSAPVTTAYATAVYTANVTNTAVAANAGATVLRPSLVYNGNTAVCYLQFFNVAQGSVTVGTTVPLFSVGIPANSGGPVTLNYKFGTAMTVAATTTRAGLTACTNGVDVNLFQD